MSPCTGLENIGRQAPFFFYGLFMCEKTKEKYIMYISRKIRYEFYIDHSMMQKKNSQEDHENVTNMF